ncbi:4-hydroxy-tetrahydrodipicolinate reductase [Pseudolysobacter antarcticus]|uniref:4-hydroxy-tetrahydrodipicolinate reductase n=1 Tax=Pseudolysobacter antarcticus TaxID=2511995 RepID=A0A411HJ26_9GAMM|nr:4-hydroxy-tetrahydrodipicolinate reductase [Pseudolysobacter antarcticus]QBB70503.1 4-hydroxy-tetrahydrodipicolinate reductase [Pseudolysobacter antarcticus]
MIDPIRVAVFGASGRMGAALMRATVATPRVQLVAALVRAGSVQADAVVSSLHGGAAESMCFSESLSAAADVLIDFSAASAFDQALAIALEHKIALVSGTTGLSETQYQTLHAAAREIPILWASNFSLGIAMLTRLARDAAKALADWDCEISEAHHRHKQDAPSGTALSIGDAIAKARASTLDDSAIYARTAKSGARKAGEIGFSVVRGGDIVGEHTVFLIGEGERIELTHRAQSRDIFAAGAVRAAAWLAGRTPGVYTIENVLGLSD